MGDEGVRADHGASDGVRIVEHDLNPLPMACTDSVVERGFQGSQLHVGGIRILPGFT